MKRIKYICMIMMVLTGFQLRAQTIQMTIPDNSGILGDDILVPVNVDNSLTGYDVMAYQFNISFNSNILTLNSIDVSGTMSEGWGMPFYNNSNPGVVTIANAGTSPLTGTGTLFILSFNCIGTGGVTVSFNGAGSNNYFNEGEPPMTFDNGYISVAPVPVLNVNPDNGLLAVGETLQFYVSGGTAPYTWDVNAPTKASISSSGLLTANAHGFTKVIAVDNVGISGESTGQIEIRAMKLSIPSVSEWQGGTIEIPVNTTSLTGLGILAGNIDLTFNGNILTPTGINTSGTLLSGYSNVIMNANVTGKVDIAFAGTTPLTGSGVLMYLQFDISALNTGNTSINFGVAEFNESLLAKTENGYFTMLNFGTIYISPNTFNLVAGETKQFSASGGVPPYTWSTSNNSVASIDAAGLLTAHKSGIITIMAEDDVGATGTSGNITVYDTYVTIPHVPAILGTQYDLPVMMSSLPAGQSVFAIEGTISFESPELQAVDIITTGSMTSGWSAVKNISGNTITFALAGTTPFHDAGIMFKVRLQLTASLTLNENAWVNINSIMLNEGVPFPKTANGSITGKTGIIVNLAANLEGNFNGTDMDTDLNPGLIPNGQPYNVVPWSYPGSESFVSIPNVNVVDWVLVELRETPGGAASADQASVIARQAALLLSDGGIVDRDGVNYLVFDVILSSNLYAVVWHRNHLGIMSSIPVTSFGGVYSYDFTSSNTTAYGTNAQTSLGGGEYGMRSGDANGDGVVNPTDVSTVWDSEAGSNGYQSGDMNLNGEVNNQDKNDFWLPNNGEGDQVPD